jgi:hypothetical protein
MSKKNAIALLSTLAAVQIHAQSTGSLQADISQDVAKLERPEIKASIGASFESNPDLVLENVGSIPVYKNARFLNIGAKTSMSGEVADKKLTYTPSLTVKLLQPSEGKYESNDDVIKNAQLNNSLNLELTKSDSLSTGLTADLNAQKTYSYMATGNRLAHKRKKDNVSGFLGAYVNGSPASAWKISSSVKAGYVDHSGNYVNKTNSGFRINEFDLENDRAVYKAEVTNVIAMTPSTTFSLPMSYMYEDYKERLARASDLDGTDLKKVYQANNIKDAVPTWKIQTIAIGSQLEQTAGPVTMAAGYTRSIVNELNKGENFNDAYGNNYDLSASMNMETLALSAGYSYEEISYRTQGGGGTIEHTGTVKAGITVPKVFANVDASLNLEKINYSESSPAGFYTGKGSTDVAAISLSAPL